MSGVLQAVFQNFSNSISYYLTAYSRLSANTYGFQGDLTYDSATDKVYIGQSYTGTAVGWSRLTTSTFAPDYSAINTNGYNFYRPMRQPTTGNMIAMASSPQSNSAILSSYTTANPPVVSWSRQANVSGIPSYNSDIRPMWNFTVQSDGTILLFGYAIGYFGVCCNSRYTPVITKLSADGTTLTNFATGNSGGSVDYARCAGGIVAASGNVYAYCPRTKGGTANGLSVVKFDSSGTVLWKNYYNSTSGNGYTWSPTTTSRFLAVDSSENVYSSGALGSYAMVTKMDSSGNVLWARWWTPTNGGFYGGSIVLDSSNNVYVWGGYGGWVYLLKYNSSGTLQFARQWLSTSIIAYSVNNGSGAIALANDGSLMFGWYGVDSSGVYGFPYYAKVPTDGSKTGSYTINGVTWEYSAASGTDAAWPWGVAADSSLTFGSTPTLSTTSNTVSVSTVSPTQYKTTL